MRYPTVSSASMLQNLCHKIKDSSSCCRWKEVLFQYREITKAGFQMTDHAIYSHVLKACLAFSFRLGQSVHASLTKQGFDSFSSIGNSLMDFYTKSGTLGSACSFFNCTKTIDSVSWNIIIHGHLNQGFLEEGVDLFIQARAFGFEPNISILVLIIQAYQSLQAFDDGRKLHAYLIRSGLWSSTSVQNSLLGMYTEIRMDLAENLFLEIDEKDVISWSVIITGYVHANNNIFSLESFKQMVSEFVEPDGQTMVSVIKGCTQLGDLKIGKSIHGFVVLRGLNYDLFVRNTIIDLYCKCGDIDSAMIAFEEMPYRNMVSWNSMLSGLVRNEKHAELLKLLSLMEKSGHDADEVTLANLLLACKLLRDLRQCKLIHSRIIRRGFDSNDVVMNSLIDTYAKCNQIDLSWRLFCRIKKPDIVTWSTMISAFTHCGLPDEAMSLYRQMMLSQEKPNQVTLLNFLDACALSAEIGRSKCAHGIAIRMGLASHVAVGTAILDMYAKCGDIIASRRAFDQISMKNVVSWSAIISAYGLNGLPHDAVNLLSEMEGHGVKPNAVTILSVLSACCHGGLVEEGLSLFKDMANKHRAELKLEHYSCLVDLLARAGNLDHAFQLIKSIPTAMKPGASAWGALLSACRTYENRKHTEGALPQILELEPSSSAGYLLASNTFAAGGSWTDASGIRCLMKERGVKIVAGYSMVHVGKSVHTFTAGDKFHPLCRMFGPVVEQLHSCMRIDTEARIQVT